MGYSSRCTLSLGLPGSMGAAQLPCPSLPVPSCLVDSTVVQQRPCLVPQHTWLSFAFKPAAVVLASEGKMLTVTDKKTFF